MAKIARVMFVMPVSCVVTVEIPEGMTDDEEIADIAYEELPGFTDHNWDSADAEAFDDKGRPYSIEIA